MADAWNGSFGSAWGSSWGDGVTRTVVTGGGPVRAWNPLFPFDRENKELLLEAIRLIEDESDVKRERAKARKLERDVKAAKDAADVKALAARVSWAVERAEELRREEDDEEDAIVLLAMLH